MSGFQLRFARDSPRRRFTRFWVNLRFAVPPRQLLGSHT